MREIQRISVTDQVVESISNDIRNGTFALGQKLPPEVTLCNALQVGRSTLREAFRVLQALGYVEMHPGRGAFVAETITDRSENRQWDESEDAQFKDFIEVRLAVETLSVRLAAKRATMEQIKELETIHKAFAEANVNRDATRLILLDELFHTKIIESTRNPLLININEQLIKHFRAYRASSFKDVDVYKNAVEPHRHILDGITAHDADKAEEEINRHLDITVKDMDQIHNYSKMN